MDGDERTGWTILYLHLETNDRAEQGQVLAAGSPVGHPSCEGGSSTGTHIHIARKYNGEWIPAAGPLAFVLEGWEPHNGTDEYAGYLERLDKIVVSSVVSEGESQISSTREQ
jgi:hypothetical protein